MGKHALRQQMLHRRRQLDEALAADLSEAVQQRLVAADIFSRAETLALYSPINNEVGTDRLFAAASVQNKQVCYPRVDGETLEFVLVESHEELQPGRFGILEPAGRRILTTEQIDLIVVPGVAFDMEGYRLGYGKGFYDRELASCLTDATSSVGLGYGFQLCNALPIEAHDQPLDYVVTEARLIPCYNRVTGSP